MLNVLTQSRADKPRKRTTMKTARFNELTTTPRADLAPADKAVQKMIFDDMTKSATSDSARARIASAYAALAPESIKAPVDRFAAAAKAQATRKANAASAASAFLASLESSDA